jgi:hypothetical protein
MKNPLTKFSFKLIVSLLVALLTSIVILGQQPAAPAEPAPDTLSGKYEGVAKTPGSPDAKVLLELKKDGAKITGRGVAGETTAEISEATFVDGTLTLKFVGREGALTAKVEGDKITGDWVTGARKGTVELKRIPPAAAPDASAPINLSGEWEAVADAQGQPFPFSLILKIEGEKVSGSSSSQLGESVISSGMWKDGQLNFQLEGSNGVITMSATVIEGKLSGVFDYAGQLQGKWVAVKRK